MGRLQCYFLLMDYIWRLKKKLIFSYKVQWNLKGKEGIYLFIKMLKVFFNINIVRYCGFINIR